MERDSLDASHLGVQEAAKALCTQPSCAFGMSLTSSSVPATPWFGSCFTKMVLRVRLSCSRVDQGGHLGVRVITKELPASPHFSTSPFLYVQKSLLLPIPMSIQGSAYKPRALSCSHCWVGTGFLRFPVRGSLMSSLENVVTVSLPCSLSPY